MLKCKQITLIYIQPLGQSMFISTTSSENQLYDIESEFLP